jgi:putative solute:sodium symporter small subunit
MHSEKPNDAGSPGINSKAERSAAYWRANKRLISILLVVWAAVSLGAGILFVEPLNKIMFGHLPLGFWMAQQGSIYVFIVLIFIYAWKMDRLEEAHHRQAQGENGKG